MATVRMNNLIEGFSGKVGKSLVFRTMHGKIFVSHAARKPNKKKESEAQRNTRVNFREATEWARRILRDAEKKAFYTQRAKVLKLPNAYTAAITDYMRKPKVTTIQQQNVTTCSVRKPGFTLPKVKVTVDKPSELQPLVNVQQGDHDWFIQVVKSDVDRQYTVTITITDNAGCERIEEISV